MADYFGMPLMALGLVIGWLTLIAMFFNITLLCMGLGSSGNVAAALEALSPDTSRIQFKYFVFIALCVLLALCVAIGIASALLIVGIYRRRHKYMYLFLILMAAIICSLVAGFFIHLAGTASIGVLLLHIWLLVLMCFVSCPVFLLCKEIRKENLSPSAPAA